MDVEAVIYQIRSQAEPEILYCVERPSVDWAIRPRIRELVPEACTRSLLLHLAVLKRNMCLLMFENVIIEVGYTWVWVLLLSFIMLIIEPPPPPPPPVLHLSLLCPVPWRQTSQNSIKRASLPSGSLFGASNGKHQQGIRGEKKENRVYLLSWLPHYKVAVYQLHPSTKFHSSFLHGFPPCSGKCFPCPFIIQGYYRHPASPRALHHSSVMFYSAQPLLIVLSLNTFETILLNSLKTSSAWAGFFPTGTMTNRDMTQIEKKEKDLWLGILTPQYSIMNSAFCPSFSIPVLSNMVATSHICFFQHKVIKLNKIKNLVPSAQKPHLASNYYYFGQNRYGPFTQHGKFDSTALLYTQQPPP